VGDSLHFEGLYEAVVLFSGIHASDTNACLHQFT
jgi:hypothetical protein